MPFEAFIRSAMPPFERSLVPAEPDLSFELPLWSAGLTAVAGIDEAGRGALAGPVSAAAVILPPDPTVEGCLKGVRDSKQLTPDQRETAREKILHHAAAWGVGFATNEEIDQIGIVPATRLAACRALGALSISPAHILLDYLFLPEITVPQTALIKGDCRSLSIAAASILAKTARDAVLRELDLTYPGYGFAAHKGYGTYAHRNALQQLGVCPVHRLSFALFGEPGGTLNGDQPKPDSTSPETIDQ
jgi:ribonuclease HII